MHGFSTKKTRIVNFDFRPISYEKKGRIDLLGGGNHTRNLPEITESEEAGDQVTVIDCRTSKGYAVL